jgi:glycopeptide antibiotics resistance protein
LTVNVLWPTRAGQPSSLGDRIDILRYIDLGPVFHLTVIAIVLAAGAAAAGALRGGRVAAKRAGTLTLLLGSIAAVLVVTIGPVVHTLGPGDPFFARSANLIPLRSLRAELGNPNPRLAAANIVGNVLLFAPSGLLCYAAGVRSLRRVAFASAVFSMTIELTQYALGRSADIDDVLLNVCGALLGAAVAAIACGHADRRDRSAVPPSEVTI